jgi:hypothetical protein
VRGAHVGAAVGACVGGSVGAIVAGVDGAGSLDTIPVTSRKFDVSIGVIAFIDVMYCICKEKNIISIQFYFYDFSDF